MFRNRRISFIVGALVAALLLLLQLFPATCIIGFGIPAMIGEHIPMSDLRMTGWILFIVAEFLILAMGAFGATPLMVGKNGKEAGTLGKYVPLNLYGLIYNLLFILPPVMLLIAVLGEWFALSEQLELINPDAMAATVMIMGAGLYIALLGVIAAPIASRFKKIKKEKAA